ncbi:hypothetical protein [Occallatibacter riparius]|uniref:Uncharacterized protein n=1 Tax=Occallatibacter riparius TaxID=1002689 RepID=A0A9J7BUA9_9BACT|nr:hypothetical protein [Occallatibacter riparius]UWZ86467.1 hypothetical protein MOP44_11090 [Occallatibacter riparius]
MIRQAISCDICGAEKRQTNHWYVACEQSGELRLGAWNSRMRQRPGTKHLCGQTCLHKLVDEFMARTTATRAATADPSEPAPARPEIDASLTSSVAYDGDESSARLIATPVFPMQPRLVTEPAAPAPQIDSTPNYASRRWRAEAWERERNRELRTHPRHKGL